MDFLKIKNEGGLELTVTTNPPKDYVTIMGGMNTSPSWGEYLSDFKEEFKPHFNLIKKSIEDLGWVGETARGKAMDACFVFSDGVSFVFCMRAWGDLMSAIVGKNEGYMAYYI